MHPRWNRLIALLSLVLLLSALAPIPNVAASHPNLEWALKTTHGEARLKIKEAGAVGGAYQVAQDNVSMIIGHRDLTIGCSEFFEFFFADVEAGNGPEGLHARLDGDRLRVSYRFDWCGPDGNDRHLVLGIRNWANGSSSFVQLPTTGEGTGTFGVA